MDSLAELKKVLLSINGNITKDDIGTFQKQLSQLGEQYEEAPTVTSFLKMMGTLGKHLDSKRDDAHADLIPTLNSIVKQLDIIINNPELEKEEINRILSSEIKKFKALQNKIVSKPTIDDNDMNDLKAVILAIDWEISKTTLQNFEKVVTNLLSKLKTYKIHYTFLKIIHSIGRYIGHQKANAHKDSISFLRYVFENFEGIVKIPDMTFKDKKQILEADIKQFQKFKRKIAREKRKNRIVNDKFENEPVQPALAHVKQTNIHGTDDVVSLTTIPEQVGDLTRDDSDSEKIEPAFANKKVSSEAQNGVMDNIFSIKKSPADELLDAIHLLDVQGLNQNQGQAVLDETRDSQPDGIKKFTPQRMDTDPIPEIGSRLDEFFNLDIAQDEDEPVEENDMTDQVFESNKIKGNESTDIIEPLQVKDKSSKVSLHKSDDIEPTTYDSNSYILSRILSSVKNPECFDNELSMLAISQDISILKEQWQNDLDKFSLLNIIDLVIDLHKKEFKTIQEKKENKGDKEVIREVSDIPQAGYIGIWGKIKGLLTS